MDTQESYKPSEKDTLSEVVISEKILIAVAEETKKRSLQNSGEFFVFILDNGEEQIHVRVGIGHSSGVSYSPEQAIKSLKPYISNGYRIAADYHNHTPESVRVYKEKGMPAEYAFSPSGADLSSDVPERLKIEFAQGDYPHLIGVYSQDDERVYINGFKYNREPSDEENKEIEFKDPFYIGQEPDELGIKLLASLYTDPKVLKNKGIISNIQIKPGSGKDVSSLIINSPIN